MAPTSRWFFFFFFFDTEVLCCSEMGGRGGRRGTGEKNTQQQKKKKNEKRNKRGVYFCRVTTLGSLVDVRSGIYKTKAGGSTANKLRLSPDRWVINKRRRRRLRRKHTPGKLKWDVWRDGHYFQMTPGVWRFFFPSVSSVSWVLTASSVSCFPTQKCFRRWSTFWCHKGRCYLATACGRCTPPCFRNVWWRAWLFEGSFNRMLF